MKPIRTILSLALVLALAPAAFAEKELVTLNDGLSGHAEILATTEDTLSVKFVNKTGVLVEAKLRASRVDPYCFYTIRGKHMEKTAENHVRLAVFCAENGLFNYARGQMALAKAIDPAIEEKIKESPKVMDAIANRLADSAKRHFDKGEYKIAYELVQVIATRFDTTKIAEKADAALDMIEKKMAEAEDAETAARQKKVDAVTETKAREKAAAQEKVIALLEREQAAGKKKNSAALRSRNKNNAKKDFASAAKHFETLIGKINSAMETAAAAGDTELQAHLVDLQDETREDAINAYLNAGNISLGREDFNGAEEFAGKAKALDANNARVQSFEHSLSNWRMMSSTGDGRRRGR